MALNLLMDLVRTESDRLSTLHTPANYTFANALWQKIVTGLLCTPNLASDLRVDFIQRFLNYYDDIRYFFLRDSATVCSAYVSGDKSGVSPAANLLQFLEAVQSMPLEQSHLNRFWTTSEAALVKKPAQAKSKKRKRPTPKAANADGSTGIFDSSSDDEEASEAAPQRDATKLKPHDLLNLHSHRTVFERAWLAVLPLLTTEEELKRVLIILHASVMPHMLRPGTLLDFLVDCCDHGTLSFPSYLNGADGHSRRNHCSIGVGRPLHAHDQTQPVRYFPYETNAS